MSKINPKLMPFLVGDLFFTTNNTNPATRFGGTWELYSKGRTIVGYDPNDTDFDTIGKTGGSKELQAHTHTMNSTMGYAEAGGSLKYTVGWGSVRQNTGITTDAAGTGNSGNLQPYITTYIWIKTA